MLAGAVQLQKSKPEHIIALAPRGVANLYQLWQSLSTVAERSSALKQDDSLLARADHHEPLHCGGDQLDIAAKRGPRARALGDAATALVE